MPTLRRCSRWCRRHLPLQAHRPRSQLHRPLLPTQCRQVLVLPQQRHRWRRRSRRHLSHLAVTLQRMARLLLGARRLESLCKRAQCLRAATSWTMTALAGATLASVLMATSARRCRRCSLGSAAALPAIDGAPPRAIMAREMRPVLMLAQGGPPQLRGHRGAHRGAPAPTVIFQALQVLQRLG